MQNPNFIILYVKDPQKSAQFYGGLLDRKPVEASPGFAILPMTENVMLGLWQRDTVAPAATAPAGGSEIAFTLESADAVHAKHADWSARNLAIALPPTKMDFGTTFVALDPDGHRIRVSSMAAA
jgi:catechol 2,3-dioxygenase-like lactoylglutathione lyase family enzyme